MSFRIEKTALVVSAITQLTVQLQLKRAHASINWIYCPVALQ